MDFEAHLRVVFEARIEPRTRQQATRQAELLFVLQLLSECQHLAGFLTLTAKNVACILNVGALFFF